MTSSPTKIDWNLAKALRAQGFRWSEICEKVGSTADTLRVRASREGWANLNKKTATVLTQMGLEPAAETIRRESPKLAEAWLAEMQDDTVGRLKEIRKLPKPKNLDDAKKREEMMLTHVKAGRSAFGLDDQKGGGVQVNIMAQLNQLVSATPSATGDATVVDVSPNETE